MDGVYVEYRIYLGKRAVLPVFNLRHDFIGHIRNEPFGCLKTINILQRIRNLPCGHAFGIHGNNLLVDIGDILLALFDHLRLKGRLTVLGDLNVHAAIAAVDTLRLITVAVIIRVRTF